MLKDEPIWGKGSPPFSPKPFPQEDTSLRKPETLEKFVHISSAWLFFIIQLKFLSQHIRAMTGLVLHVMEVSTKLCDLESYGARGPQRLLSLTLKESEAQRDKVTCCGFL